MMLLDAFHPVYPFFLLLKLETGADQLLGKDLSFYFNQMVLPPGAGRD